MKLEIIRFAKAMAAVFLAWVIVCVQTCSADPNAFEYPRATSAEIATGLMHLEIREHQGFVEVSGDNPNSGMLVSKVTIKRRKHDLIMKVHFILFGSLHPLRRNKPGLEPGGLSHYKITLPPDINRILAVNKKDKDNCVVIWERTKQIPPAN